MPTAMSSLQRPSTAPLTAALLVIASALSAQAQEHTLYDRSGARADHTR